MQGRYAVILPVGQYTNDIDLLIAAKVKLAMRLKGISTNHIDSLKIVSTRTIHLDGKDSLYVELS